MGLYNFIRSNLDKSVSSDNLAVDDDIYSYEIYYTQDMADFMSSFIDFIVDLNFDFRKVAARRLYWYNSLVIDKINKNTKIRPIFDASGHINFDWDNAPIKIIKDCVKELDKRKLLDDERIEDRFMNNDNISLGQYILNRVEGDNNIRNNTIITIWDIFTEHTSYHDEINKWLLGYLKYNYGSYDAFIDFFKEIKFKEIASIFHNELKGHYIIHDNPIDIKESNKIFSKLKSTFIDDFLCLPIHHELQPKEISGMVRDFRSFEEEFIKKLLVINGFKYYLNKPKKEKFILLVNENIINGLLKNKLFYLWMQLDVMSHEPKLTSAHLKELTILKNMLKSEILPEILSLIESDNFT